VVRSRRHWDSGWGPVFSNKAQNKSSYSIFTFAHTSVILLYIYNDLINRR